MKAIILAAGKGTRMLPLTKDIRKELIDVGGRPFLSYLISNLLAAGFDELGFVVGHRKEQLFRFCKDYGVCATFIEQKEQLGVGHAVLQAKDFVGGDNFLVLLADNLWSAETLSSVNMGDGFSYIACIESDHPQDYGVCIEEDGNLVRMVEKPQRFIGNLVNTGLCKFTPDIFPELEALPLSARGEYEYAGAISSMAGKGKMKVVHVKDYWLDMGKPEDVPIVADFIRNLGL